MTHFPSVFWSAVKQAGVQNVATLFGVTRQAMQKWKRRGVPEHRIREVSKALGIHEVYLKPYKRK